MYVDGGGDGGGGKWAVVITRGDKSDLLCTMVIPSPGSTIRASEVVTQASGASGRELNYSVDRRRTARGAAFDPKREEQSSRGAPPPRPLLGTSATPRNSQLQ